MKRAQVDEVMLEPHLRMLNCGERVAPEEIRGITKFLQAAEREASKGFNLNALSFALSIWYCDLSGTWARSLQSDVSWLGAQLKAIGGFASRGSWWLQNRSRQSSVSGRGRGTARGTEDVSPTT